MSLLCSNSIKSKDQLASEVALFYRRHTGSAYGHRDWSQSPSAFVSGADLYKPLRYPGGHWLLAQGGRTLPLLFSSFWGTPSPACVPKLYYQAHLCRCLIKPQLASLLHARPESRGACGWHLIHSAGAQQDSSEGWLTWPGKVRNLCVQLKVSLAGSLDRCPQSLGNVPI